MKKKAAPSPKRPESPQDERAPYEKRILATVSQELTAEFGHNGRHFKRKLGALLEGAPA